MLTSLPLIQVCIYFVMCPSLYYFIYFAWGLILLSKSAHMSFMHSGKFLGYNLLKYSLLKRKTPLHILSFWNSFCHMLNLLRLSEPLLSVKFSIFPLSGLHPGYSSQMSSSRYSTSLCSLYKLTVKSGRELPTTKF